MVRPQARSRHRTGQTGAMPPRCLAAGARKEIGMRVALPAIVACLALAPLGAQAQPNLQQPAPRLVIGAPGSCQMTVNGDPRPCSSGLVYVHHTNGSILLSVQSGGDVTIGFEADSDRQPTREEYTLNLTRLHTSVSGQTAAKMVSGTCQISMSTDGQTWHRAVCRAKDRSNLETVMTFTGNGQQVTAARPGEEGQGAVPPGRPALPPNKG
jgi:hypothetical protein